MKLVNHHITCYTGSLTIPSGSINNKCFGEFSCIPVNTYWPGVPCDSRTKKSPSSLSRASAAARLMFPWYHDSVSNCDFWISDESVNGSVGKVGVIKKKIGVIQICYIHLRISKTSLTELEDMFLLLCELELACFSFT
jgi:hypothetical protein